MNIVGKCLQQIRQVHLQFGKQPNEFRPRYWVLTEKMLETWLSLPPDETLSLSNSLSHQESDFLPAVCRSASTSTVEETQSRRLTWGLLALFVSAHTADYREWLIELTLLDNSAKKLSVNLEDLMVSIPHLPECEAKHRILSYMKEGYRNIDAMGYVEGIDKFGRFTYGQAW